MSGTLRDPTASRRILPPDRPTRGILFARTVGSLAFLAIVAGCADQASTTQPVAGKAASFGRVAAPVCTLSSSFSMFSLFEGHTYQHDYQVTRSNGGKYTVTGDWTSVDPADIAIDPTDEKGTVTISDPNSVSFDVLFTARNWKRHPWSFTGTFDVTTGVITGSDGSWSSTGAV